MSWAEDAELNVLERAERQSALREESEQGWLTC